jgi:hypothetical protein
VADDLQSERVERRRPHAGGRDSGGGESFLHAFLQLVRRRLVEGEEEDPLGGDEAACDRIGGPSNHD